MLSNLRSDFALKAPPPPKLAASSHASAKYPETQLDAGAVCERSGQWLKKHDLRQQRGYLGTLVICFVESNDMPALCGQCLCGNIRLNADTDIRLMANCHCKDCRAATGAAFGTLLSVAEDAVEVRGDVQVHHHTADSGASMEKHFCPQCGAQLFVRNSIRAGVLSVRAGVVNETELVEPAVNV